MPGRGSSFDKNAALHLPASSASVSSSFSHHRGDRLPRAAGLTYGFFRARSVATAALRYSLFLHQHGNMSHIACR
jgi:hypothetical protein